MKIRSVGSRHTRSPDHQSTDIQTPGQFRLALAWRESWRAESLKNRKGVASPVRKDTLNGKDRRKPNAKEERKRFAESIARAEFGRAYWDERRQRGLQQQGKEPPARK